MDDKIRALNVEMAYCELEILCPPDSRMDIPYSEDTVHKAAVARLARLDQEHAALRDAS